jgi:hypothetical protein
MSGRICDRCCEELLADDLRKLAAAWAVGGLVNALDEAGKPYGHLPPAAHRLAAAARDLLDELGITDGRHPLAADVFRERP